MNLDDADAILDMPQPDNAGPAVEVANVLAQFKGKLDPAILQRYVNGESVQAMAQDYGVNRQTIYNWMLGGIGDKHYGNLVTAALVKRIADADDELDRAQTRDQIAKAREKMRFFRMDLERRRPGIYGPKQEMRTEGVVVHVNRGKLERVVQDVTPEKDE